MNKNIEKISDNDVFVKSLKIVREHIRDDEELFFGYQSNIAMAFVDEMQRSKEKHNKQSLNKSEIHIAANEAAKNFLNMWIKQ